MLTGMGYRVNAWFITLFFVAGAVGCIVLVPLAVDSLHKRADSKPYSCPKAWMAVTSTAMTTWIRAIHAV